jgi:FdhD protein
MSSRQTTTRSIRRFAGGEVQAVVDHLALEEPLEIQVAHGQPDNRQTKTVAITMRTPGHDTELAAGFLVGEGLLQSPEQLEAIYPRGPRYGDGGMQHSVRVTLRPEVHLDLARLERHFYTTSSCGVCGKTSIEALEIANSKPLAPADWHLDPATICALPVRLRESQTAFDQTGGLHAAGLFTPEGRPVVIREDVGRHNAVDKVIGAQFIAGRLPLARCVLVVSGRASFELMQKAIAAGIPVLVAVGAPSSLAIDMAEKFGATLVGFTKTKGFNIYAGAERVTTGGYDDEDIALISHASL